MLLPPTNLRGFRDTLDGTIYRVATAEGRWGSRLYRNRPGCLEPIYRDLEEEFEEEYPDAI